MSQYSILILPGDGIGAEVMDEVRKIIDWFDSKRGLDFDVIEDLVGGALTVPPNFPTSTSSANFFIYCLSSFRI